MTLLNDLSRLVGEAFASEGLAARWGEVVVSQRPELAQFQCNGALAAAKESERNPRELGEAIAGRLASLEQFAKVEVAGPGFINLTLSDEVIARYAQQAADDPRLGTSTSTPETVVVDYAGPNVAKAMHVGHLRATIIGDSLQRIFRFLGHKVIRDPHFGDWGFQMGLLIAALAEEEPDLPYFDPELDGPYPDTSPVTLEDLQTIYPQASERAERDEAFAARARQATVDLQQGRPGYLALWRHMKRVSEESQRRDFADLGVEFDLWYGESDVADRLGPLVERLRESGMAIESRGALIVPVDLPDDKRDLPPLILETSVGGYLYSTTDLATLEMRAVDLGADLILYVVDARQADHFEQIFRAARQAGLI
ncbi:MAG TPA: arginine--tRNA ligase, partial [Acidimicrobiia bacterium]|nr:arginine--tRNA ligase [Acidimicrobiia bacterium]